MVSSQLSILNGDCRQKPLPNHLVLPSGPPDVLPSDYVESEFSHVFGSVPLQASIESSEKTRNLVAEPDPSEIFYIDPEIIHSRSHSLLGPTTYISQSLKLSKITLTETEGVVDVVEVVSGETPKELKEYSVDDNAVKKPDAQFNNFCLEHRNIGLEDFEVLKVVGQGAFGKVYQVRRNGTSEIYAMKVMRKDKIMQRNNADYVKSERDILTKMDHPFIVRLIYSFQVIFFPKH